MDASEFLSHYGKKGMKWGVRKQTVKVGASKDSKRVTNISKKAQKHTVKSLTSRELKEFNARMELETKFNSMNPSKVKKGHDKAKALVALGVTVNSAYKFTKSPAGKAIMNSVSGKSNNLKEYDVLLRS